MKTGSIDDLTELLQAIADGYEIQAKNIRDDQWVYVESWEDGVDFEDFQYRFVIDSEPTFGPIQLLPCCKTKDARIKELEDACQIALEEGGNHTWIQNGVEISVHEILRNALTKKEGE